MIELCNQILKSEQSSIELLLLILVMLGLQGNVHLCSMNCLVLCSLTFSFSIILVYGDIEDAVPTVYSKKNTTVVLKCQFNTSDGNVQWYRLNPEKTYSQGQKVNPLLPQHKRLRVVGNYIEGEFNLQISKVREQDTGKYYCSANTNQSIITKAVFLQIAANNLNHTTEDYTQLRTSHLYLPTSSAYSSDTRTEGNNNLTNVYYGLLGVGVLAALSLLVILADLIYRHCHGRSRQTYQPRIQNSTSNVDSNYDYVNEEEMMEREHTENSEGNTYLDIVAKDTSPSTSNQNSLLNEINEGSYETPYNGILPDHLDNCQYDEIM